MINFGSVKLKCQLDIQVSEILLGQLEVREENWDGNINLGIVTIKVFQAKHTKGGSEERKRTEKALSPNTLQNLELGGAE